MVEYIQMRAPWLIVSAAEVEKLKQKVRDNTKKINLEPS